MNAHLLDVHERHFQAVHEQTFFALLQTGNPMREQRFDVSKAPCHSCS